MLIAALFSFSFDCFAQSSNELIQVQNHQTMKRMGYSPPPTQAEIYQDLQQKALKQHKIEQGYDNQVAQETVPKKRYNGKFKFSDETDLSYKETKPFYDTAFNEIKKMLEGELEYDLKKAVYLVENVVLQGELSYAEYTAKIEELKSYVLELSEKNDLDFNSLAEKHYIIQRLFSDTTDRAFNYDFNDIYGDNNYINQFVTKLLFTGTGQCRSMPLMYLILADEFNLEAYLAFSPRHSYIKFRIEGKWYNYETTNGCITSDGWVMGSGYVKAEALRNHTYLQPLTKEQLLAHLLVDLAISYRMQLGYDDFLEQIIDKSLTHYYHLFGVMERANLESAKLDKAMWKSGVKTQQQLQSNSELSSQLNDLEELYKEVDNLGYSEMPDEAYADWLKSLEEKRSKQETIKPKIETTND